MPCIHGVSNLEHPSRSKQVLHVQDQFFLEFVRCRLRPQTSRHYSLTSRTPCPCAIHSSKRNTQQLPSKPSAAANSTTYRVEAVCTRRTLNSSSKKNIFIWSLRFSTLHPISLYLSILYTNYPSWIPHLILYFYFPPPNPSLLPSSGLHPGFTLPTVKRFSPTSGIGKPAVNHRKPLETARNDTSNSKNR